MKIPGAHLQMVSNGCTNILKKNPRISWNMRRQNHVHRRGTGRRTEKYKSDIILTVLKVLEPSWVEGGDKSFFGVIPFYSFLLICSNTFVRTNIIFNLYVF